MKKKLIIFHPAIAPYRIDFFNQLSTNFDAKFYISLSNPKEQKFNQDAIKKELNFEFKLLKSGFELFGRTIRFGIWQKLREHKPRIVICSEYSQATVSVLLYKSLINKKIKVYTICDDSLELSLQRTGIRKWIRTVCSKHLDGIIFPSNKVGKWYNENVAKSVKTMELPIIHGNNAFRNKLENALDFSNANILNCNLIGKKVFLFVGRLVAIKNVDLLIKTFARAEIESGVLIIVGDGEERSKLEQLAENININEKCFFTGRLEGEELLSWYNIAQCFILPSYVEPYGAVVDEALLAGCKVLCSELAGAAELITNENGAVFNPYNENELTEKLQKISTQLLDLELPLSVKSDLMPFSLESKLTELFLSL